MGVPKGAAQMTMDALYSRTLDEMRVQLRRFDELAEGGGLDTSKVMAARAALAEAVELLGEASGATDLTAMTTTSASGPGK